METPLLHPLLECAVEAARLGGKVLMDFYGKIKHINEKHDKGDLVTEADIAAEKVIFSFIQKSFPDHGLLGEESGAVNAASPWQWIIDPLDGTTNFAHAHPMFAVSIGILHEGKPVAGVIYNPYYNELFQASLGGGARLNGSPIFVSKVAELDKSLLASGFPYDRRSNSDNNYKEFCCLTHATQGVRRCGSAALDLAFVAAGRVDGYWERGIKPWDIAAGIIIVREAGGLVTRYDATPLEGVQEERLLATNGRIHGALSRELLSVAVQ